MMRATPANRLPQPWPAPLLQELCQLLVQQRQAARGCARQCVSFPFVQPVCSSTRAAAAT